MYSIKDGARRSLFFQHSLVVLTFKSPIFVAKKKTRAPGMSSPSGFYGSPIKTTDQASPTPLVQPYNYLTGNILENIIQFYLGNQRWLEP